PIVAIVAPAAAAAKIARVIRLYMAPPALWGTGLAPGLLCGALCAPAWLFAPHPECVGLVVLTADGVVRRFIGNLPWLCNKLRFRASGDTAHDAELARELPLLERPGPNDPALLSPGRPGIRAQEGGPGRRRPAFMRSREPAGADASDAIRRRWNISASRSAVDRRDWSPPAARALRWGHGRHHDAAPPGRARGGVRDHPGP